MTAEVAIVARYRGHRVVVLKRLEDSARVLYQDFSGAWAESNGFVQVDKYEYHATVPFAALKDVAEERIECTPGWWPSHGRAEYLGQICEVGALGADGLVEITYLWRENSCAGTETKGKVLKRAEKLGFVETAGGLTKTVAASELHRVREYTPQ
ncbi:hypothetical protein [Amycolatopsis sp. NPDC059657]|uniref:hypothetical protein n=1 Tax=Amycolatopsis sp. NPDC059657 TaxID=3346899 RepID=UPI00366DB853